MWAGIKKRRHEVQKVFVHDEKADDLTISGRITWNVSDGGVLEDGFIHRLVLDVGDAQKPKIKMFRGYTVCPLSHFYRLVVLGPRARWIVARHGTGVL